MLHCDGDQLLFATNSSGTVDDIKIGMLGDVTPLDPGFPGLTVWDRNPSGMADSNHNYTGHDAWRTEMYSHQQPCETVYVPAAPNSWASSFAGSTSFASARNVNAGVWMGHGAVLFSPGSDGYSDGVVIMQGVRAYDSGMQQWTTPDAFAGMVHDPMTQKAYMWNRNNPVEYQDPSGFWPCLSSVVPTCGHRTSVVQSGPGYY